MGVLPPGIQAYYLMDEEIVPVCSPRLIQHYFSNTQQIDKFSYELSNEQLLQLPLLQQTTRLNIWQEWFSAHQIQHPAPFDGQRHELFSMLAVAASHGMGMALIPQMLIESELQQQQLVITSSKKLIGSRKYYLVHSDQETSLHLRKFVNWVLSESQNNSNL